MLREKTDQPPTFTTADEVDDNHVYVEAGENLEKYQILDHSANTRELN